MKRRNIDLDKQAIELFKSKTVLTIDELANVLNCSLITVRRRLKEWKGYSSYNKNNRYYTLPSIPKFSKKGIWKYQNIFFSKHGTFKKTIIHFVRTSKKGMSNSELEEALDVNPNSLMAHLGEVPELIKERHKREIVYFSSDEDICKLQKENRYPASPPTLQLPPDAVAIIILVELIHNPGITVHELSQRLQKKGSTIKTQTIKNLFTHYNVGKKKL
ncbi:hypothetical protein ES705_49184 [subsurface metagenome]